MVLGFLMAVSLMGCGAKQAAVTPPVRGAAVVASVQGSPDRSGVEANPAALDAAVARELAGLGLAAKAIPSAEAVTAFENRTRSTQRMAWVVEQQGSADLAVLVEASARFYAEMSGRYRWTVAVTLQAARPGQPPVVESMEIPVFLDYAHLQAPDAIAAAAPMVARRLRVVLEDALAAGG